MAKAKSKSKQKVNEFTQPFENIFLAGLGALANAQKMGSETFDSLVKDGRKFRAKASKKTDALMDDMQSNIREMGEDAQERAEGLFDRIRDNSRFDKFQNVFDKRVADTMDRLNVPSKNDIDKINKKLNKILRTLESQDKSAPARKRTTAKKKASVKKAPAAKPAGKSEKAAA